MSRQPQHLLRRYADVSPATEAQYELGWEDGYSDAINGEPIDADLGGGSQVAKLGYRDGFTEGRLHDGPLPECFERENWGNKNSKEE